MKASIWCCTTCSCIAASLTFQFTKGQLQSQQLGPIHKVKIIILCTIRTCRWSISVIKQHICTHIQTSVNSIKNIFFYGNITLKLISTRNTCRHGRRHLTKLKMFTKVRKYTTPSMYIHEIIQQLFIKTIKTSHCLSILSWTK